MRRRAERFEPASPASPAGGVRLSKRMSELGLASRREADEWIARGWVRVDGRVVCELGSRVLPGAHITIDDHARGQQEQRVTILLHKPVGWVSGQAEDGYEPAIALVKADSRWDGDDSKLRFQSEHLRGIAPAGRLDIDSVGLLVFTQDGRIARQLIGEDSEVDKEYLVRVEPAEDGGRLSNAGLALLRCGLALDGVALRPASVEWVNEDQLRFVLREGRKRQIRRMCEAVGLKVTGLKRVRIGQVMLGDLPAGQWRYLRPDEHFAEPTRALWPNPGSTNLPPRHPVPEFPVGNKIKTEADRRATPQPPAPLGVTRTNRRGQRVSLERGVATRSKKNPGKRSKKGG